MTAAWMAITGQHKRVLHFPMFGALTSVWRSGNNLVPDNPVGTVTWEQCLRGATPVS